MLAWLNGTDRTGGHVALPEPSQLAPFEVQPDASLDQDYLAATAVPIQRVGGEGAAGVDILLDAEFTLASDITAHLSSTETQWADGTTGRSLAWSWDGLVPGLYEFTIAGRGWAPSRTDLIVEGELRQTISLTPVNRVSGVIVSQSGQTFATCRLTIESRAAFDLAGGGTGWGMLRPSTIVVPLGTDGGFSVGGWDKLSDDLDQVRFRAALPGHISATSEWYDAPGPVFDLAEVQLVLAPAATLRGQVTDAQGAPVGGAFVRVARADEPSDPVHDDHGALGVRSHTVAGAAVAAETDASGRFVIRTEASEASYVDCFHPGHPPYRSESVALEAGRTLDVDIRLEAAAALRGMVTRHGVGIAGATVSARPSTGSLDFTVTRTTDADGSFLFESLSPGPQTLSVATQLESGVQMVVAREDVNLAEQTPPMTIAIDVATAGGTPIYISVSSAVDIDLAGCLLDAVTGTPMTAMTPVDDDRLELRAPTSGDAIILISGVEPSSATYVMAVLPVHVPEGASPPTFLVDATSELTIVCDPDPRLFNVSPETGHPDIDRALGTLLTRLRTRDGQVRILGLPHGTYRVSRPGASRENMASVTVSAQPTTYRITER